MADEPTSEEEATGNPDARMPVPLISKTLGGRQFWVDTSFLQGWRIQKNVVTGHYRLLDPRDIRHASGTLDECNTQLEAQQKQHNLKPASGHVVIFVHGLVRSSKSFHAMTEHLRADGYTVVGFDYASTRISISDAADCLHGVILSLGSDVASIDFVVHSMGGLVLRSYLHQYPDQRHHRAVLLGVPNRGSEIADAMKSNSLFRVVYGPAGQQLGTGEEGIAAALPTPDIEFGIVAGGKGTDKGFNPLFGTDNDSTVTVESTRLPGASDFLLVPVMHSFLMNHEEVVGPTEHFLKHGRFSSDRPPEPISVGAEDVAERGKPDSASDQLP